MRSIPLVLGLTVVAFVLVFAVACDGSDDDADGQRATQTPIASPTVEVDRAAVLCAGATASVSGTVESPELVEISGLVASRANDGVLWAHNDSGDTARVFPMSTSGEDLGQVVALLGIEAIDWEDIALGPGPEPGRDYIYVGDIGDNAKARSEIIVYRVAEPDLTGDDVDAAPDTLTFTYPDSPHDAEVLLVDPIGGDLVIITKEIEGGPSSVFRAAGDLEDGSTTTLELVAEIDFASFVIEREIPEDAPALVAGVGHLPTGGDVSPGGDVIAVRTYATVWLWPRESGQELWAAFTSVPCEAPSELEVQGEAIAFNTEGLGYFTASEGLNPPVNDFR